MSNHGIIVNPPVGSAALTKEQIEGELFQRTEEWRGFELYERQLDTRIASLEEAIRNMHADLTAAKSEKYAVRQRVEQARRELQNAYNRYAVVAPVPPGTLSPDVAPHPAQAFAQPGGALDQERAAAMRPGVTATAGNAAEAAETRRLYELTLSQMQARNIPIAVKDETGKTEESK